MIPEPEITDDLYLIEVLLRYCRPKEPKYSEALYGSGDVSLPIDQPT